MTNDENRMTKEARNPNAQRGSDGWRPWTFVLRASSFFRHSDFVIRHLLCGCALVAGIETQAALAPQTLHSRSGQFVVTGLPLLTRSWAASTSAVSFVRLDPTLAAVSCEAIKTALLDALGLQDGWKGSVVIAIHPTREDNEPIDVVSVHYQSGWTYEVGMADQVDRSRFIRAIVEVLVFEIANREGGSLQAEVPPWLVPGLAAHLEAATISRLALEPRTSFIVQGQRYDALAGIRGSLGAKRPLNINQLNWPEEVQTDEQERGYRACAQLLVHDLLRLKNGRRCMVEMLKRLHESLNWQTAFLAAFAQYFPRLADWDKWWSSRVTEVFDQEAFAASKAEEQLRHLDNILKTRSRAGTNAADSFVTLQTMISEWPLKDQLEALRQKVLILRALRVRATGKLGMLIGDYGLALEEYVQSRTSGRTGHGRSGDVSSSNHIFAQAAIKRLDQLDARRATWDFRPAGMTNNERTTKSESRRACAAALIRAKS